MSKESDIDKLKSDLEALIKDAKKVMSTFKDAIGGEVDHKKEQLKEHLEDRFKDIKSKIPSSEDIKNTVGDHAKSNWIQYLTVAFVVGIVVGSVFKKEK
jgi:ElaB/YqjD/DUF883 family membrane-anchored ribosome-binding protein